MLNSERFLIEYNKIVEHMRNLTKSVKGTPFPQLVELACKKKPEIRTYKIDLLEFSDLRNAVIHERTDEHVIAEPNDRAVQEIEHIASLILKPPNVMSVVAQNVATIQSSRPIAEAIKTMYDNNYSQLPVYDDNKEFVAMLTTDTVARWLGACIEEDIFSLKETPVSKVLSFAEENENFEFLGREKTVFKALELFDEWEKNKRKHLDAILITDSGKRNEKLLGIITVWDIRKIYEKINGK